MAETWVEHESCARCGASLGGEYRTNHLGVRFCHTCYDGTVAALEEDRAADPAMEQVCNRCRGSLINGYHANYMGVLFCVNCFERTHTPEGRPRSDWAERDALSVAQQPRDRDDESENPSVEEEEGVYLHDVFFITTILALIMYAVARFGGALMSLGGY